MRITACQFPADKLKGVICKMLLICRRFRHGIISTKMYDRMNCIVIGYRARSGRRQNLQASNDSRRHSLQTTTTTTTKTTTTTARTTKTTYSDRMPTVGCKPSRAPTYVAAERRVRCTTFPRARVRLWASAVPLWHGPTGGAIHFRHDRTTCSVTQRSRT